MKVFTTFVLKNQQVKSTATIIIALLKSRSSPFIFFPLYPHTNPTFLKRFQELEMSHVPDNSFGSYDLR